MDAPARDLDPSNCTAAPLPQLRRWLTEAGDDLMALVPMTLATATPDGRPSARVVLLRDLDDGLVFFTNYESRKGRELARNPWAAAVLYWPVLDRQARFEGPVTRLDASASDAYFARRPLGHRLAALASPQSEVVADRAELERRVQALVERHRHAAPPPRPPFWGGLRLIPDAAEFWQGRMHRLHDRVRYAPDPAGGWRRERLAP